MTGAFLQIVVFKKHIMRLLLIFGVFLLWMFCKLDMKDALEWLLSLQAKIKSKDDGGGGGCAEKSTIQLYPTTWHDPSFVYIPWLSSFTSI